MGLPMLRRFLTDKAANIAVVSAIAIVPTVALIGGGADIVRVTSIRSELRAAVESSVLAAASLNAQSDIEAVVNNYLDVNLADYPEFRTGLVLDVDYVNQPLSRVVSVTASCKISTNFLCLVAIDELPVTASAEAREGKTSLEVSLVLDISGSMDGARITEMKDGAEEFVNLILTDANKAYTAVSVVPFGDNVNIGQALFDSHVVPMASAVVDRIFGSRSARQPALNMRTVITPTRFYHPQRAPRGHRTSPETTSARPQQQSSIQTTRRRSTRRSTA